MSSNEPPSHTKLINMWDVGRHYQHRTNSGLLLVFTEKLYRDTRFKLDEEEDSRHRVRGNNMEKYKWL